VSEMGLCNYTQNSVKFKSVRIKTASGIMS
jgi:hypothetical protein